MIKFFRNIRQKLLAEGRLAKYLLYAIGEILLVVIGILIALQINNQNEARKARNKEISYLQNLKVDLQNELKNNEQFATFRFNKAEACAALLNGKEPQTIKDVREYTDLYESVFIWYAYVPNNNTFIELLSSGNLSMISNDSIKNGLLELDNLYTQIANGENHMKREYDEYLYDANIKNTYALEFFDLSEATYGFPPRLSPEDIPESERAKLIRDARWLHKDRTFQNGLKLAMMNNGFLASMHKDLVLYIEDLIKLMEDEISK